MTECTLHEHDDWLFISQVVRFLLVCIFLLLKWFKEAGWDYMNHEKRSCLVFLLDCSKQVVGSTLIYTLTMVRTHLHSARYQCAYYFESTVLDNVLGTFFLVLFFQVLMRFLIRFFGHMAVHEFRSGDYKSWDKTTCLCDLSCRRYFKQLSFWVLLVALPVKLFTMLMTELLGLCLLPWISQVISSFGSSALQVWIVFLIVPTGFKIWSFWIVDTYIKELEKPSHASQNHVELNNVLRPYVQSDIRTQQIAQEQDEIGSVQSQEQGKLQDDLVTPTRAQVPGFNEPLLENRIQDSLEESAHAESGFPQTMESRQDNVRTQEEKKNGSQNGLEISTREQVPPTLPVESNLDLEEARGKGKGKGKIPPLHSMGKGKGKVFSSGKVLGGKGKVTPLTGKTESNIRTQSDSVQPPLKKWLRWWKFVQSFLEAQAKAADPDICCFCRENMAFTGFLLMQGELVQCSRGHLFHYECMANYARSVEKYYILCPFCRESGEKMNFTLKNGCVTFE